MVRIDPREVIDDLQLLENHLHEYSSHVNNARNILNSNTLNELFTEDDYTHIVHEISQLDDDAALLANLGAAVLFAFHRWVHDPVLFSEELDNSFTWNEDLHNDIQDQLATLQDLELFTPQHLHQATVNQRADYSEYTYQLYYAYKMLDESFKLCVAVYPNMLAFVRARDQGYVPSV